MIGYQLLLIWGLKFLGNKVAEIRVREQFISACLLEVGLEHFLTDLLFLEAIGVVLEVHV